VETKISAPTFELDRVGADADRLLANRGFAGKTELSYLLCVAKSLAQAPFARLNSLRRDYLIQPMLKP
jgi:hypothetical protein